MQDRIVYHDERDTAENRRFPDEHPGEQADRFYEPNLCKIIITRLCSWGVKKGVCQSGKVYLGG